MDIDFGYVMNRVQKIKGTDGDGKEVWEASSNMEFNIEVQFVIFDNGYTNAQPDLRMDVDYGVVKAEGKKYNKLTFCLALIVLDHKQPSSNPFTRRNGSQFLIFKISRTTFLN